MRTANDLCVPWTGLKSLLTRMHAELPSHVTEQFFKRRRGISGVLRVVRG
jgi:hypothetical protein